MLIYLYFLNHFTLNRQFLFQRVDFTYRDNTNFTKYQISMYAHNVRFDNPVSIKIRIFSIQHFDLSQKIRHTD